MLFASKCMQATGLFNRVSALKCHAALRRGIRARRSFEIDSPPSMFHAASTHSYTYVHHSLFVDPPHPTTATPG